MLLGSADFLSLTAYFNYPWCTMFFNFSDIPGHQNLFLDYLYEFDNVKSYYKHNFRNRDEYLKIFSSVSGFNRPSRQHLSTILSNQYSALTPSEKTLLNIQSLSDENTLAVVTGQQLGIAGGPLYTLYKIITAIKLSENLSARYEEFNFVPVFWLEGDDHDFNEIRSVKILGDANELTKISYGTEAPEDEDRNSVGYVTITEEINLFFEQLDSALRDSDFKPGLLSKLKEIYMPGRSLKEAFRDLIFWMFDKNGLVIFDPQDSQVKELLKPLFLKEVSDFRNHAEKLVNRSAEIEEIYHAQVKVRPVNLFYRNEEGRFLIEPVEEEFRLKRKRKKFSLEEIKAEIEANPSAFSPNVLFRPVCQDYILPTACYVAGPGEISYFAQVSPLYEHYTVPQPVIYPRASITILEKHILNIVEKYDLKLLEIIMDTDKVKQKLIESLSDTKIDDSFEDTSEKINQHFDNLKEKIFEIDKTMADASEKYRQRIVNYLDELRNKVLDAQKRKHETTLKQIDRVAANVFPGSVLQERELNFVYFWNKYGEDFLKRIFEETEINTFEHQVIKF